MKTNSKPGFAGATTSLMHRYREALSAVLQSACGPKSLRATSIAETLNLDLKLAWKLARIVEAEDPFAAARYVPGEVAIRKVLRSVQRAGGSREARDAFKHVHSEFLQLVETHAQSRREFDILLAGHTEEDRARADLDHRRQMFEGGSYVWGVQARATAWLDIIAPSADPDSVDVALVRGYYDLRRMRPDVPWRVALGHSVDDAGTTHTQIRRRRITDQGTLADADGSAPLLRSFCSQPVPDCRRVAGPRGTTEFELARGAVGNTGLVTCVTGELLLQAEPRYCSAQYRDLALRFSLRTPSEVAVLDVLFHRSLFGKRVQPNLGFWSELFTDRVAPRYREGDRLPITEEVEYLGNGEGVLETPTIPRYADLARTTLQACGWNSGDFDVFRVLMRYPPVPTTVVMHHALPQRAG